LKDPPWGWGNFPFGSGQLVIDGATKLKPKSSYANPGPLNDAPNKNSEGGGPRGLSIFPRKGGRKGKIIKRSREQ